MKKIILSLMLSLLIYSVSFAAGKIKNEIKGISSVKNEPVSVVQKKMDYKEISTVFHLNVITMNETCCDGTTRTSYIVWSDNDPLNSVYIPDPRGDCPICPPDSV
jgi:hypothetical protein